MLLLFNFIYNFILKFLFSCIHLFLITLLYISDETIFYPNLNCLRASSEGSNDVNGLYLSPYSNSPN